MRRLTLHTWLGRIFLVTGTFVASSAIYLGLHRELVESSWELVFP
jgi:hypothetical protein